MTPLTMAWGERVAKLLDIECARIIEIGSRNVNGSYREFLEPLADRYIGVDIIDGPGVDVQMDVTNVPPDDEIGAWDIVVCTETLEHVERWHSALQTMIALLRVGGLLILTTRMPGFVRHEWPSDYWRFDSDTLLAALGDTVEPGFIGESPLDLGVYITATKVKDGLVNRSVRAFSAPEG